MGRKTKKYPKCGRGHDLRPTNLTASGKCLACRRLREGWQGNKHNRDKAHCPRGHPYSGDNLAVYTYGSRVIRVCKECRANKARKYYNNFVRPTKSTRKTGRKRTYKDAI